MFNRLGLLLMLIAALTVSSCGSRRAGFFHTEEQAVTVSPLAKQLGFSKDRPLVMGMNTSYAPLQYVDDKGTPSGYDVEFTKVLMRRMGIPFAFSPNHWDKMSPGVIEGKYDLGMLVYSAYRKELTNYSNAVFRMYYQIVYRKKDYTEFDFRHLKGRRIAYMKSRPIGLMLKKEGAVDDSITDLRQAFLDLAKGRYDGLICYRFQAKYDLEQLGLTDQLQADELSLEPREYCYASHDSLLIMLALLTFVFLVVFSVNRYRLSRHLQIVHKRLQIAYRQMEENNVALQAANIRAEESTRMKTAFIKQISHEIRTPLNILSGFTQVLATPDSRLSEAERAEASRQVVESTARITGLVNKMLELSDISSNTVLNRDEEVTAQYVASLAVMTSGVEKAEHIDFDLRFEAGVDQPFKTHLSSVVRIVELLLDNAIKFTHPPEAYMAKLKVTRKERVTLSVGYENGVVRFVVEDTGIGIPEKEAEHIFDEFVQLDEYYDGTGIGLAVARSLARRLDGDVVLDTSYTNGARFVVTLAG